MDMGKADVTIAWRRLYNCTAGAAGADYRLG